MRVGREVREMGAPLSYLTGLLYNLSFAKKLTQREGGEMRVGREVREIGAPLSYLTGLLYNLSFAPEYN
jgi:hypothetical protein